MYIVGVSVTSCLPPLTQQDCQTFNTIWSWLQLRKLQEGAINNLVASYDEKRKDDGQYVFWIFWIKLHSVDWHTNFLYEKLIIDFLESKTHIVQEVKDTLWNRLYIMILSSWNLFGIFLHSLTLVFLWLSDSLDW